MYANNTKSFQFEEASWIWVASAIYSPHRMDFCEFSSNRHHIISSAKNVSQIMHEKKNWWPHTGIRTHVQITARLFDIKRCENHIVTQINNTNNFVVEIANTTNNNKK